MDYGKKAYNFSLNGQTGKKAGWIEQESVVTRLLRCSYSESRKAGLDTTRGVGRKAMESINKRFFEGFKCNNISARD